MKLTWPEVTDIKHPRYTNRRYLCPYCTLRVSKSLDLWCAFDRLSNFEKSNLRWGHLMWSGGVTFEVRRATFSGNVSKCAMNSYAKFQALKGLNSQPKTTRSTTEERRHRRGANDCGRAAAHPRPLHPPPNRLWYLSYLGIRSPLVTATASMSGCPATANIFDGTAWSLLLTDRGGLHSLI